MLTNFLLYNVEFLYKCGPFLKTLFPPLPLQILTNVYVD